MATIDDELIAASGIDHAVAIALLRKKQPSVADEARGKVRVTIDISIEDWSLAQMPNLRRALLARALLTECRGMTDDDIAAAYIAETKRPRAGGKWRGVAVP